MPKIIQVQTRRTRGMTLVEIMLATVILAVAVLGALIYQYYAVKHTRRARADMAATRVAQMLLEDWKSTGGSNTYDPITLDVGFSQSTGGAYEITINNIPMFVNLARQDIAKDDVSGVTLREIQVTIGWRNDYQAKPLQDGDPSLVLTTYTRMDQQGG